MQQAGESFEQFLTELKLLVKDCGHADPDEMVRDHVVIGCYSSKAWEKLIPEGSDLTLEKAIDIARKEEIWQAQLETMATENPSINSVKTKKQKTLLKRSLERIVVDVAINMTKANAQLKERSAQNVTSWSILPVVACRKTQIRKEWTV